MTVFKEFAAAKINLTLEVLGRRPDGYHELKSLVAFADVGDYVTLDTSKPIGVTVSGPFAGSIAGANLVEVVLRRLEIEARYLQLGAVHLEKNLPVAAGIGGGSADAAAVIRAVQRANPGKAADVDWLEVALRIGSDVPVCLESRLSWMTGLGEKVTPLALKVPPGIPAVIVNPLVPVPADKTARVFKALAAPPLAANFESMRSASTLYDRQDVFEAVMSGSNALEAAACSIVPDVRLVLDKLSKSTNCRMGRMSGGGPTCFALYDAEADARSAAETLQAQHPDWWVRFAVLN